jgi:tRNA1Val (adenine37-N6)-methyltransferase
MVMNRYTEDTIWAKDVRILQPKSGYRFAIDAILLAHFLQTDPHDEVLEIGTGAGVIPVLLSRLKKFKRLVAVEIQEELADLARTNIQLNQIPNVEIFHADIRDLQNASFDLIFANPPYRKTGSGKLNPNRQKAVARHELSLRLEDVFDCAAKFLKPNGRLSLILPAFREKDFLHLAGAHSMHLQQRRYVHSFAGEPAAFFLATLSRMKYAFEEGPPLLIYAAPGKYSEETDRLLNSR